MNINNLEKIINFEDCRLSNEQKVMMQYNINKGFEAFIEPYLDYCYLILVKEGVRNGFKRLNRTGHDVHIRGY